MQPALKKMLPRSLLARSLLILVMPVLLIQVVTVYIFFDRHWDKMTSRLAYAVAGEISVIADQIESGGDVEQIAGYAARALDLLVGFEVTGSVDEETAQKFQALSRQSMVVKALAPALRAQVRRPLSVDVDSREKWIEVTIALKNGILHVSLPQRRLFSSSGYIVLLWMMGSSVVLLAIAIIFMRNQIRPILRLAVAAERFGKGLDVPATFKPEGAREVRQAGKAFMEMNQRIRRQIQQRTTMLTGVSHDLRTPLTRMRLQLAVMKDGEDIEALKADISDMERMIGAYLEFARGEGGEQPVRVGLREMMERVAANARREGGDVVLDGVPEEIFLELKPVAFERSLNNLIGNACKYADHVWVQAKKIDDYLVIFIDDDGPGVPEEKYEDMFRPFVRGEPSRSPLTGGIGLGLPIAQDIIHAHGGRIRLERSPKKGLRVVVEMPL